MRRLSAAVLYASGLSLRQCGKILGVSKTTVGNRLKALGIKRRKNNGRQPITKRQEEIIRRLYFDLGLSKEKIAKILSLTYRTVNCYLATFK